MERHGAPTNGLTNGKLGLNPYKWSYNRIFRTGRGPPCSHSPKNWWIFKKGQLTQRIHVCGIFTYILSINICLSLIPWASVSTSLVPYCQLFTSGQISRIDQTPWASIDIFSDDDWGVQSPPKRIVFRFHYRSQFRWARILMEWWSSQCKVPRQGGCQFSFVYKVHLQKFPPNTCLW